MSNKKKEVRAIRRSLFGVKTVAAILIPLNLFIVRPCLGAGPRVTAGSAVLYDQVSQEVLFEKNMNEVRPPASTTKIMTGIIVLEMGNMDEQVEISSYAASMGGSSLYLREGEVLNMENLLWGTLLKSGNDAAVALAEGIAGSETFFVELMNRKAVLVGALNTKFLNTNGLPKKGHVSTSYDLAMITDYALKNQAFADIVSTKEAIISGRDKGSQRNLRNTNRLLGVYEGATGVKTGTTNAAGQCLVASAEKGSRKLISVVLGSGDRYGDSKRLLDHGFEEHMLLYIPKGTVAGRIYYHDAIPYQVDLVTMGDLFYTVSKEMPEIQEKRLVLENFDLPENTLQEVGFWEIKANKQYTIPVCLAKKVRKKNLLDEVGEMLFGFLVN